MSVINEVFSLDVAKLVRAAVAVPLIYVVLIALIRLSGKRTTSQMNNFDWIVTVALGSLVAAAGITSSSASVLQVLLAITLLIGLQFAVTWLVLRSDTLRRWVKPRPRLLFYEGEFLCRDMRAERVSELELLAAIRASGHHELNDVGAVVLETDATLSVLGPGVGRGRSHARRRRRLDAGHSEVTREGEAVLRTQQVKTATEP